MKEGKVYLTGGGCGDAGLLTLKALEALRACDAVVYDSLAPEELLKWTRTDCEKIYAGKRYGSHAMQQSEINVLLAEKAREGKTVVRLKGGDPYVFGRGGEEFLALKKAGICCEEIPGISSAIAVPAAAGIPVTHRGYSAGLTIVTGTAAEQDGHAHLRLDFDSLARLDGTLVILMGMHCLKEIAEGLTAAGKNPDTPCAVIMEGTTGRQRCMRTILSKLYREAAEQGFTSPAVIVVGAVAELELLPEKEGAKILPQRAELLSQKEETEPVSERKGAELLPEREGAKILPQRAGFLWQKEEAEPPLQRAEPELLLQREGAEPLPRKEKAELLLEKEGMKHTADSGEDKIRLPLTGITVGATGTPHFVDKLSEALRPKGAEMWKMDFMEIRQVKETLPDLENYVWLVFTSPNGASVFLDKMKQERRDMRTLNGKKIAVIGPGTAAVFETAGIYADYMPEVYDAAHLAEGLSEKILTEQREKKNGISEERRGERAGLVPAAFLRARRGSEKLPLIFTEKGIPFAECPLYEPEVCERKRAESIVRRPDYIVFGSAMGVRAYFEGMEKAGLTNLKSKYVCIGEMCGEELSKHTDRSFLTAEESSIEAIVDCLCADVRIELSMGGEE